MIDKQIWQIAPEAEYSALRAEILKRLDIRYQLINYVLGAFAALLALGFELQSALIVLVYPFIATGLSLAWLDNYNRLKLAASYLRQHGAGWENALEGHREKHSQLWDREKLGALSIVAIFPGTQIISIVVAVPFIFIFRSSQSSQFFLEIAVLIVAIVAWIYTLIMFVANQKDRQIYLKDDDTDKQND